MLDNETISGEATLRLTTIYEDACVLDVIGGDNAGQYFKSDYEAACELAVHLENADYMEIRRLA